MRKIPLTVKTDQEAFDAVVRHLATLKGRAFDTKRKMCVYSGRGGTRCVAGALLDCDDTVAAGLDGTIRDLITQKVVHAGEVTADLLGDLQYAHDREINWSPTGFAAWDVLAETATKHRLDPAVLEAYA